MAKYGLDYQFLLDRTGGASTTYEVSTTPTTYFIAPGGTIALGRSHSTIDHALSSERR